MKNEQFNNKEFWAALENTRISKKLSWRQVAEKSGVSASTLTRISQGKRPDVDSFSALIQWSGLDSQRFVGVKDENDTNEESLPKIMAHLRADKNLDSKAINILEVMIQAAYTKMSSSRNDGD